jgi:hypothetical protein
MQEPLRRHRVAAGPRSQLRFPRPRPVTARHLGRLFHLSDNRLGRRHLSRRIRPTGDSALRQLLWISPRPDPLRATTTLQLQLLHLHRHSRPGLPHVYNMGFANPNSTPTTQFGMAILLLFLNLQIYLMLLVVHNGGLRWMPSFKLFSKTKHGT